MPESATPALTGAHWGVYRAETREGRIHALHPFEHDPAPSAIGQGMLDAVEGPLRIAAPMVRKAWLEGQRGDAPKRSGSDPFVQISWDDAETLVAAELDRVRRTHGNEAIYGGSYGWASAGRFHHAQSQLHRFLNCIGGYTRSVNSYSLAAGEVILSHILGGAAEFIHAPPSWAALAAHTGLVVAFGGIPLRNSQVSAGGTGCHETGAGLRRAKVAGVEFVNLSPIRGDMPQELGAHWITLRPGSDVAVMLGLAHEIFRKNWHDQAFLARYCEGFETFAAYLTGQTDGVPKTPEWAATLAGIPAPEIKALARRMVQTRTLISVSWSLTRQDHGEQPFWMATTLAAMLGQIGLPGGGIAYGYGAANSVGNERRDVQYAALPQLENPVDAFIPVARIADMLLNPDAAYRFNGKTLRYPDIRLVYWAGGNPFHHHQDLGRLCRAWQRPETVIVHDYCWNAVARRADIVLPCTTPLERDDVLISPRDRFIVAMKAVIAPVGLARDDHAIFRGLSRRMDVEDIFTEGRSATQWIEWIYAQSREMARKAGIDLPAYACFMRKGWHETPRPEGHGDAFAAFRASPEVAPLRTLSGKIEITSRQIATFQERAVYPHPAWYEPVEWLGRAGSSQRFHLISSQPADKLHSQLDHGRISRAAKRNGRSPLRINPTDAAGLGLEENDCVRVSNARGAFLATVVPDDGLMRGVVQVSTGAWLAAADQPDGTLLCVHGNPNTVTRDAGTSELAQGPVAHSCLVGLEKVEACPPPNVFTPPEIIACTDLKERS